MLLVLLAVGLTGAPGGAEPRNSPAPESRLIDAVDLLRFAWIADPRVAPDGRLIVFVHVSVDEEEDRYRTALWTVPADGREEPRPFTSGPDDSSPRWSPDGRFIAFLRQADGEGGPPQLHLIPVGGGEAVRLTSLPRGVGSPAWSPDGRMIAFTSTTNDEDLAEMRRKEKDEAERPDRRSDVRVITRAVYRFNGRGYLDPARPSHIWTIAVPEPGQPPPEPSRITSGEFDESDIAWAPDGSRLYFTSNRVAEPYYFPPDRDLYSVPAGGGELTKMASIDGSIGDYAFAPDGRMIAFRGTENGNPVRSYNQPDLFVVENRAGAVPRNLTAGYDADVGSGLAGDQHAPRGGQVRTPIWTPDGRALVVVSAEHGRANLVRIDVTSGEVTPVTSGDQEVVSYTASDDGVTVALVSTVTSIGDLFAVEPAAGSGTLRRLTDVNRAVFAELTLAEPEELWYESFDGRRIQGWILEPPGFDPARTYPMILEIHGGPHAAYGHTFFHEFQWMAAKGYVVLYTNPRGSSAYGQAFGNVIQYRYPGDDYRDLMAGVDALAARGYIDEDRMGVTGGSGGGLLTNWVVTQTDRFAAAVSQRSISDWAGFWYTADFTLFTPTWFRGAPWETPEDFAARSPITHVGNVTTPLMLIVGEEDYRTPMGEGGEQMFRALKYLKRPTVLVSFPGESHELSRSGRPWHRIERLQQIVGWFDKYLRR